MKPFTFAATALCLVLFSTGLFAVDSTNTLTVDGVERTFILHVPPSYDDANAMPLLFMFHGLGGTAAHAASDYYNWNATADSGGFIVVYPDSLTPPGKNIEFPPGNVIVENYDGTGKRWDVAHIFTNDDCRCDSQDLDFVEAILDWAVTNYNIRTSHVFTTGHSYGAFFSYYAAVCLHERIMAFGEHSGGIIMFDLLVGQLWWPIEFPGNQPQIQGILIHSPGDPVVVYAGSVLLESLMTQYNHPVEFITLDSSMGHNWDKTKNQAQWNFFMAHAPAITNDSDNMTVNDFDGDGKTDLAVYHEASGYWFIVFSSSGSLSSTQLGESGYDPVPGDFDGDGKTDRAVYHEASGYWFIIFSSTGSLYYEKFGEPGYTPVTGDFDGDGKTDLAVFHESTGYWFIVFSSTGSLYYEKFGEPGYTPVTGDFDGDGKTDLTVYHESSGYWFLIYSSTWTLSYEKLGGTGYLPVSGDFDGDSKTDLAVFHESTGYWFIVFSSTRTLSYCKLGETGYLPVTGDFDGDGKTDLAVYHEVTGYWFILSSASGELSCTKFGESGYVPL